MRRRAVAIAVLAIVLLSGGLAYYEATANTSDSVSLVCNSTIQTDYHQITESGFKYICGTGSVSDGRLEVTLHNYRFAEANSIHWLTPPSQQTPPSTSLFLLANVTVTNIGAGNTSLGGGFAVQVTNGSGWFTNQELIANASFPGTYPNQALPDIQGGLYLPPKFHYDLWLLFLIPASDSRQSGGLVLQYLSYREIFYGGDYTGYGAFSCTHSPCSYPLVQLVIQAP